MSAQPRRDARVFDVIRKISADLVGTDGNYCVLRADSVRTDWRTHTDFVATQIPRKYRS